MQAINFLKEVKEELSKVVWPTREQTARMTTIVIIVAVVVGMVIGGFDFVLAKIAKALLGT